MGRAAKTREQILEEADRIRREIEQVFIDTEYWNSVHPNEEPINPDPDGMLARIKIGVMVQDVALQNEVLDIGLHWLQEQIGFAPELEPVAAAYSGLIALTIPPGER
jgi:hypothetical protein